MIDVRAISVEEERYKNMLRKAEQKRIAQAALSKRPKEVGIHGHLLLGLGRSLTALGLRLQTRYGAMIEIPGGA